MDSRPRDFPVSLQAWPSTTEQSTLPTLIQRLALERNGFRNVDEESLREEIARDAAERLAEEQSSSDDESEEQPDRFKELMVAKGEMLNQINSAHQAAMVALDFISLLLSKDTPVQASLSISPHLREVAGMGTLGADKLPASKLTDAQKLDNKQIATGWKTQNLSSTVDSILASAVRLEKEIELETKYWEQVLAVSEKGWAVCRLPNAKHILGVRYGFSEASPAFKNRSLAALQRNPDGTISLDQGAAGSVPQALRVRIQTNDEDTGSSPIPKPEPEDAPIESLILQARNTIFASELWQELNREARGLGSFNVRAKGDTLVLPLSDHKNLVIDLVALDEYMPGSHGSDDATAEGASLALHLLLSYAHRQTLRRRTQLPPPLSSARRPQFSANLLRPLLTCLSHQSTLSSLRSLLSTLTSTLGKTQLTPSPHFTLKPTSSTAAATLSAPERTLLGLTDRLEAVTTLYLTSSTTLTVTTRTAMNPVTSTSHFLALSADSPLNGTCIAPPNLQSFNALQEYILYATSCALASHFATPSPPLEYSSPFAVQSNGSSQREQEDAAAWHLSQQPNVLRKNFTVTGKIKQLSFHVQLLASDSSLMSKIVPNQSRNEIGVKLKVSWEHMHPDSSPLANFSDLNASTSDSRDVKRTHKRVAGDGIYEWVSWENRTRDEKAWDNGEGEVIRDLEGIVLDAAK